MLAEERRATLLREVQSNGYIEVRQQAEELEVSTATIRRDLDRLQREGLLVRTRGGAVRSAQSTTLELPYDIKRGRRIEHKRRIAQAAAEMVFDGETLILDAGSTTYELALLLLRKRNLTVVTNDLKIAVKLASNPNIALVCTGGVARADVYSLQGSQTEKALGSLRVNKTFLGADAIHRDGVIANVNLEEVAIKQAMVHAGQEVVLLADSSKFEVTGFAEVCTFEAIDVFITDDEVKSETLEWLAEWPTRVRVV
jgi:DeoR family transcriptional regulator of aga operon